MYICIYIYIFIIYIYTNTIKGIYCGYSYGITIAYCGVLGHDYVTTMGLLWIHYQTVVNNCSL